MIQKQKWLFGKVATVLAALICLIPLSLAQASSLIVHVHDDVVDIRAEQVPLIDILKAITGKQKMILQASDSLRDPVSLELKGTSVEKCIRRLMANRNYILTFTKTEDNRIVPVVLRVLGPGTLALVEQVSHPPHVTEDPMKRFRQEWFGEAFRNSEKLLKEISAESVKGVPQTGGIRLTRISAQSVFNKIGLEEGDLVSDVNGRPVRTIGEFIKALQVAPEEQPMLRIERLRKNDEMDPVYIEFQ